MGDMMLNQPGAVRHQHLLGRKDMIVRRLLHTITSVAVMVAHAPSHVRHGQTIRQPLLMVVFSNWRMSINCRGGSGGQGRSHKSLSFLTHMSGTTSHGMHGSKAGV